VVDMPAAHSSLPDADLVEACRQGDAYAWEALVKRLSPLAYGIARRAGLSPEAAADVLQEVFERLVQHLDQIEQPARVSSWIATTARRAALRTVFSQVRVVSGADAEDKLLALEANDPLPGQTMERLEEWHALRSAVDQLDARCGTLLRLLFYGAQPPNYGDVARALGIPQGSIGPTRARCLGKLRRLMQATLQQ
jgi:RNA polymerase sigma factor (sigma-70 family)